MHTELQFIEKDQSLPIPRSPLIWIIIPLSLGYLVFSSVIVLPSILGGIALLTACLAILCSRSSHLSWQRGGLILLIPSLVSAGGFNLSLREQAIPEIWNSLPPREVDLTLRLERAVTTHTEHPYTRGIGKIITAPSHSPELQSHRVSFILNNQNMTTPSISGSYRIRGVLHPPEEIPNPYSPPNVHFNLRQGSFIKEVQAPNYYHQILNDLTDSCSQALAQYHPTQDGAQILTAMVLGQRSQLSDQDKRAFIRSGTMHLFAVSGLHVLAVSTTFYYLVLFLPISPRFRAILTLLLSGIYVLIVGAAPSAIRAFLMITFYLSADLFNRPKKPFPALTASALVVLLLDPYQLFSVGFQLSYLVVTSILLLGIPLAQFLNQQIQPFTFILREDETWFHRSIRKGLRLLISSLAISCSASLGSAPIILLYFGIVNLGAFLLNALLVPIASLIVIDGILILLFSLLGLSGIGAFLSYGAHLLIQIMTFAVDAALRIPGFTLERVWTSSSLAYLSSAGLLGLLIFLPVLLKGNPRYTVFRYILPFLWVCLTITLGSQMG